MPTAAPETLPAKLWRYTFVAAARIGERLGWNWLIYNWGVTRSFHQGAMKDAPKVVRAVTEAFPSARRIADVGCGTGVYTLRFREAGLDAVACEYSRRGRERARALGVTCHPFDVAADDSGMPGAPYDLAMSLEVAEHVPAALADNFVRYITRTSDLIVFTAAQPGQGGIGHINEQPREYWIERFRAQGFRLDDQASARLAARLLELDAPPYLPRNMMVFRREGAGA
jgi:SAM-dependent methyltransferase